MSKTYRRLLLLPAAALALSLTQAASAHADSRSASAHANVPSPSVHPDVKYFNLQTRWDGGECLRPDLYWPLGQSVHEYSCADGLAHHWQYGDVLPNDVYTYLWAPNFGCLIPNWDREGSPVVVTGGGNVCAYNDSEWQAIPVGGIYFKLKNVATGLVLDYDVSGANRGLQLWRDLGGTNQEFSESG